MTSATDELRDLARAVQRLAPDRRDPEKFHADKSEIAARLRKLAQLSSEHSPQRPVAFLR